MTTLSLIIYSALVMEGHLLTAQNVFTTMALYSNIKHSLCGHFGLQISYTLQGFASLKRVQNFLLQQEKNEQTSSDNGAFCNINYYPDKDIEDVIPGKGCDGSFTRLFSPMAKGFIMKLPDVAIGQEMDSFIIDIENTYNNNNNGRNNYGKIDDLIPKKVNPSINIQNMTCYWNDTSTHACLKNINLNVTDGELVAISGPVGAGKTSLLMSILEEICPANGQMNMNGSVVCAPQIPWLFSGTIKENILFGLPYDSKRYQETIEACQLVSDFKAFPNGDATLIGERGVSLSGGQRSRVSLARAVYFNADVYLLDDPFSALDNNVGEKLFEKCIKGLLGSRLVILVTHHLRYLQEVDRIVFMKEGNIIADGNYEELRQAGIDLYLPTKKRLQGTAATAVTNAELPKQQSSQPVSFGLEISEEEKASGSVPFSLYWKYFRAGNSKAFLAIACLLFIATQGK